MAYIHNESLGNCSNQQLRDIYHTLIGKPMGLRHSGKMSDKSKLIAEVIRLRSLILCECGRGPMDRVYYLDGNKELPMSYCVECVEEAEAIEAQ